MKIGFLFPGQGSQSLGMGKDLYDEYEDYRKVYDDVKKEIAIEIARMKNMTPNEIVEERYNKFRNMGEFVNLV